LGTKRRDVAFQKFCLFLGHFGNVLDVSEDAPDAKADEKYDDTERDHDERRHEKEHVHFQKISHREIILRLSLYGSAARVGTRCTADGRKPPDAKRYALRCLQTFTALLFL